MKHNEIISIGSVTYAMKAKDILKSSGIKSEIEKISHYKKSSGCAYGLYVQGDTENAHKLLLQKGVKTNGIIYGNDRK